MPKKKISKILIIPVLAGLLIFTFINFSSKILDARETDDSKPIEENKHNLTHKIPISQEEKLNRELQQLKKEAKAMQEKLINLSKTNSYLPEEKQLEENKQLLKEADRIKNIINNN